MFPLRAESRVLVSESVPRFLTASVALELGILLALSLLFPFMIHLLPVPEDARLGPRLLPMFYAPLLAALLGRSQSAFAVALLAPWLNTLLTGHPSTRGAVVMDVQLVVFTAGIRFLLGRVGGRWFLAAPAYVAGMLASTAIVAAIPSLIGNRPALPWSAQSVIQGLPGLCILLGINFLAVRHYPTGGGDDRGPMAA